MRLAASKIEELDAARLVGWKPVVICVCGSAAQTKRPASRSYSLKTTAVVSLRGIDAQLKTDVCDRAHDCARDPGRVCGQDSVPKLLRLERPCSSFCQRPAEADPWLGRGPRV